MATRKKEETSKEVATKQGAGAVAAYDFGDDAGSGYENQTRDDQMIPFLNVLQGLSPQCGEDGLDGARPGMLHDSATDELYSGKGGVLFLPCFTQQMYCEWTPREQGGGLVAQHQPGSEYVERAMREAGTRFGKIRTSEGTDLVQTFYVFGLLVNPDTRAGGPMALALASTKIKPYRGWMTRLGKFMVQTSNGGKVRPPLFAHFTKITTREETRASGKSYNVVFTPAIDGDVLKSLVPPNDPLFLEAKALKELVEQGQAKADVSGGHSRDEDDADSDGKTPF